ncbi:MAG: hypothetical protein HY051_02945 [Candidatus Aenigmarchaeota archaeon]|nr:hypothetical protein [Candidatus Aenigmarchaeota archaeon]
MSSDHSSVDFLLACPLPEEWAAMASQLGHSFDPIDQLLPAKRGQIGKFQVVCVQVGKYQENAASSLQQVITTFEPRWVLIVGIAGGFPDGKFRHGDVIIASNVYGVVGKIIGGSFKRRPDQDWRPDRTLLEHAELIAKMSPEWVDNVGIAWPKPEEKRTPKVDSGYVVSINATVDDLNYPLVQDLRKGIPEADAIEMEGTGVGSAIRLTQSKQSIGALMIRGISDVPGLTSDGAGLGASEQRALWRHYAAGVAATFVRVFLTKLTLRGKFPDGMQEDTGDKVRVLPGGRVTRQILRPPNEELADREQGSLEVEVQRYMLLSGGNPAIGGLSETTHDINLAVVVTFRVSQPSQLQRVQVFIRGNWLDTLALPTYVISDVETHTVYFQIPKRLAIGEQKVCIRAWVGSRSFQSDMFTVAFAS